MAQATGTAVEVLIQVGTKDGVYLLRADGERDEWRVSGPKLLQTDADPGDARECRLGHAHGGRADDG